MAALAAPVSADVRCARSVLERAAQIGIPEGVGRVKVWLQVVAWMRVSAGAAREVDVVVCGLWFRVPHQVSSI
jgi:hypothetical protein